MIINTRYILLFCILLILAVFSIAQDTTPDELEVRIGEAENDTLRCALYEQIASDYLRNNPAKAIEYANMQLHLAKKLSLDSLIISAYISLSICNTALGLSDSALYFARKAQQSQVDKDYEFSIDLNMGNVHETFLNPDSAKFYYNRALVIAKQNDNERNMATSYNNLGLIFYDLGELQVSFQNFLEALKLFEKHGDKGNQAITMNNIGLVNMDIGNQETAITYFLKAIGINKEINDDYNLSMNYSNLGVLYKNLGEYETALEYYNKSLAISETHDFTESLARHYHNIGNVYLKTNAPLKAKESYLESLRYSEAMEQETGLLHNSLALAQLEMDEGSLASAERHLQKADELIDVVGIVMLRLDLLEKYALLAEKRGNYAKALFYQKQFKAFADSMQDIANRQQIDEMQIKYESEKKSLENDKLREQDFLNQKIIRNQQLLGLVILVSLMFMVLFTVIIFRSRQKLRRSFRILKKLNAEVVSQKEKLEEANETKDKMFSIVAHDLRSPFSALLGLLDLMTSDYETMDDVEKREMLEVVNNQSIKTYGLLENLLQWSMMQRGMIKPCPEELELFSIVHSQFNELKSRAGNKQIELINQVPAGLNIYIDETICNTLLRNLINNAIKFTGRGGSIKVEASDEPDEIIIRVIDNGIGMSQEEVSRLFLKNIHNSTPGTENESGTGLGLRIVKDFMDLLNAKIQVESQAGKGTVFILSFRKK